VTRTIIWRDRLRILAAEYKAASRLLKQADRLMANGKKDPAVAAKLARLASLDAEIVNLLKGAAAALSDQDE
jgi:hypothetical protein